MTIAYALKISEDEDSLRNLSKEELQEVNKTLTSTLNSKLRKGHYSKSAKGVDKDLFNKYYSDNGKTQHSMEKKRGSDNKFTSLTEDDYIENIREMREYLEDEVKEKQFSKRTVEMMNKMNNLPSHVSWDNSFHGISQPKGSAAHSYIYENFVGNDDFDNIDLYKIINDAENGDTGAKMLYNYYLSTHTYTKK